MNDFISDPSSLLKEVLKLFQLRSAERRKLLAEEVAGFQSEFCEHNNFFISSLAEMENNVQNLLRSTEQHKTNDLGRLLKRIISELNGLRRAANKRRVAKRHKRMAFAKIAETREAHEYYNKRIIRYVQDNEMDAIRAFYGLISDSFGYGDLGYQHDLLRGINFAEITIQRVNSRRDDPAYGVAEINRDLIALETELASLREGCQRKYAQVAQAFETIRLSLLDL